MRNLALNEWAERLGDLTSEQIKRGLQEWSGKWPPNVEEFRAACLGSNLHNTAAYKPFPPGLPRPKAKPETAAAALRSMRAKLGMNADDMAEDLRKWRR